MTSMLTQFETACFTGHRPKSLSYLFDESDERYISLKQELKETIIKAINSGITHFILGMAEGIDLMAFELVEELKYRYPKITTECAIPFWGQESRFSEQNKVKYIRYLKVADKVTTLSQNYFNGCFQQRNKYMVDNSSLLIAVYNGNKSGGTASTIKLAKAKNLDVWLVKCWKYAIINSKINYTKGSLYVFWL